MKFINREYWFPVILALVVGLTIGWIDTRPNWNDTGITVGLILITSILLGLLTKRNALLIALIIGLCITSFNYVLHNNLASAISFIFALAGVYSGVGLKHLIKK